MSIYIVNITNSELLFPPFYGQSVAKICSGVCLRPHAIQVLGMNLYLGLGETS